MTVIDDTTPTSESESATQSPDARGGVSWFLIAIWLFLYASVVVAWGQRNSWPDDLLLCLLSLPVNVVTAWLLYDEHKFGLGSDPSRSQQEQLIAALILALGVASGQRLFMALGLVALGISWLRPRRRDVDWLEWLKIPLLFLTILPIWLDFEGSRATLATLFGDRVANPVYRLPLGIVVNQAAMLSYFGLVAMVLVMPGRSFWRALPTVPLYVLAITLAPRVFPAWNSAPPILRLWLPWLIGPLAVCGLFLLFNRGSTSATGPARGDSLVTRWFEQRRYPPWVAVLVVAAVQVPSFRPIRWDAYRCTGLIGVALTMAVLAWLRHRSPRGPIHSRSVAFVAGAVALALLGEFATRDEARHVGLAVAFVGLLSWHCFWPLRIYVVTAMATILFLGLPTESSIRGVNHETLFALKVAGGSALLGILAWMARQPLPIPGAKGYSEESWVPPKRFALILLMLVLLFQIAGAYWPEHDLPATGDEEPTLTGESVIPTSETPAKGRSGTWLIGPAQLTIAELRSNPSVLNSPDHVLRRWGWTIRRSVSVELPAGEGTAITAERDGTSTTILWWFEHQGRAFANHLYARRILWSSWHLADRRPRLIRIESSAFRSTDELIDFARRNQWFAREISTAAGAQP